MPYFVQADRCTGCGLCMDICPSGSIQLVDDAAHIDPAGCEDCGACADLCPEEAIMRLASLSPAVVEGRITKEGSGLPSEQTQGTRGIMASAGATLGTLGRALVPHMITILTDTLAQRAADSQSTGLQQTPRQQQLASSQGDRRRRRERRRRGGRRT